MILLSAAGLALLIFALFDIVVTTITLRGAGPMTSRVMQWLWSALLSLAGRRHHILAAGGTAIIVLSILMWVVLLWAAWSLIFLGGRAIVETESGMAANAWDTIYFAGFTLFTLGLGDYRPEGPLWQILTGVCVANGLLALTMSVTYLVPVLAAAAGQRQLAARITALGATPEGILRSVWNGRDFSRIGDELQDLTPSIILQAQQHLSYPSLHYFHSDDPETAFSLRIAALDEALFLLAHAAPAEIAPDNLRLQQGRKGIELLLDALEAAHIDVAHEPPPPDLLEKTARDALPSFDGHALKAALAGVEGRRRLLLSFVENDGRGWEEVFASPSPQR